MRISDWSSDVCSSDLRMLRVGVKRIEARAVAVLGENLTAPDDPVAHVEAQLRRCGQVVIRAHAGARSDSHQVIVHDGCKTTPGKIRGLWRVADQGIRTEERRVGKEGGSTCKFR